MIAVLSLPKKLSILVRKSRTFFRQILRFDGIPVDRDGTESDSNGIRVDSSGLWIDSLEL